MDDRLFPPSAIAVVAAIALTPTAHGQCEGGWNRRFGSEHVPIPLRHAVVFDDGSGSKLWAAGQSQDANTAAHLVFTWDGQRLAASPLTFLPGLNDLEPDLTALGVYDDGRGPALYLAGSFRFLGGLTVNGIARWDGSTVETLGSGLNTGGYLPRVYDMQVFDDGSGPALVVAGDFTHPSGKVASWDGTTWSTLNGGLLGGAALALAAFDDGSGPALYVGGTFSSAGGTPASNLARWDGTSWTDLGADGAVSGLAVYDDGSGPALYACGYFSAIGGTPAARLARWDGTSWSPVGSGITGSSVTDLGAFDIGSGPSLYVAGSFTQAGSQPAAGFASWNGAWTGYPQGVPGVGFGHILEYDDGGGAALFAVGDFTSVGGVFTPSIGRWNGAGWSRVGTFDGPDGAVEALAVYDGGAGPELVAGGTFDVAGSSPVEGVAAWNGSTWRTLGANFSPPSFEDEFDVRALLVHDDGSGSGLFVAGRFFRYVTRWNGSQWLSVGTGMASSSGLTTVNALCVFDDGSGGGDQLYAAGRFTSAGGTPASWIARWNGSSWSALGSQTFQGGSFSAVDELIVHDDGSGPQLYASGSFDGVSGVANTSRLARWDGSTWSSVGGMSFGSAIRSLAVIEPFPFDGSPPLLVANGVWAWDGTSWSTLGPPADGSVDHAFAFDDGASPGDSLFVSGSFTQIGGVSADGFARWDGSAWHALDPLVRPRASALFDSGNGAGPTLFLGGDFGVGSSSDEPPRSLAEWANPCPVFTYYCTGKTSSTGCVPFVLADGTPSASSTSPFRIEAHQVPVDSVGVVLYGAKKSNLAFHGGKLCIKAPITRLPHKSAKQTGPPPCEGVISRNFNARIQSGLDPSLTVGATVYAQCRGRDAGDPFGDLLTSAVRFVIAP